MGDADELERRVAALETQVQGLTERVRRSEHDTVAARVLAGGVDRDVSEIRAEIRDFRDQHNRVLTAMRGDLTDLTRRVDNVTERLDALSERTEAGFARVRGAADAAARRPLT